MPILVPDPWRKSFFDAYHCPDEILIPTKDPDAYQLNPEYNWVYNKLLLANCQKINCAPHGIPPDHYPVFSKPIYNLKAMGAGSRILENEQAYTKHHTPGHMWSTLFEGKHISTDLAILDGKIKWLQHTLGHPLENGTFDYWELLTKPNEQDSLDVYLKNFISTYCGQYSGMMNIETIGGKIIEAHLRFSSQWPELYGKTFVENLISLYAKNVWQLLPLSTTAYSVVLFGEPKQYKKPNASLIDSFCDGANITSIQLPFHEHLSYKQHAMPPGGFRLAIINGFSLEKCLGVREKCRSLFKR